MAEHCAVLRRQGRVCDRSYRFPGQVSGGEADQKHPRHRTSDGPRTTKEGEDGTRTDRYRAEFKGQLLQAYMYNVLLDYMAIQ